MTSRAVGIYEAKNNLSQLLERVEAGETIAITRHGKQVALLTPVRQDRASARQAIAHLRKLRKGTRLDGLSIRELRDRGKAMTWIVDSSVALAWCFEDETTPRSETLLDRTDSDPVVVPLHWPLEVTNVLRSAVRRGRLTENKAAQHAAALMALPVHYDGVTHQLAFTSIWRLAHKYKLTTYDAAYLELALRLNAPLATDDAELAQAATKAGATLL